MVEPLTQEELIVVNYLKRFLEVRSVLNYDNAHILQSAIELTTKDFHGRFIDEGERVNLIRHARKMLKDYAELMKAIPNPVGPSHWSAFVEDYGRENQE